MLINWLIPKGKKYFKDKMSLRLPGDENDNHDPDEPIKEDFKLYTMDLSYFSGKLEMYLRYKEISFKRVEPHALEFDTILYPHTGTEQLPQLLDCRKHTPQDKRWLRDTTPMIEYLEKDPDISEKSLPILPSCPVQEFFQFLIEDYADEHLWRPAMFYRWEPEFDRKIMGIRFTYEFARTSQTRYWLLPSLFRAELLSLRQWLLSSYGEDAKTEEKKDVIRNQYLELLDILQQILSKQPYLFGNRPTLVDFGFAGPFFRHFSSDFTPRKIMQQRAPAVWEWLARLWNAKQSNFSHIPTNFPADGMIGESFNLILPLVYDYLEYSHLNAIAYKNHQKSFDWKNKNQIFHVPTVHYRVWCRKTLQHRFLNYPKEVQDKIEVIMRQYNLWDIFWCDGIIECPPECNTEPPFCIERSKLPYHERTRLAYKWDHMAVFLPYFMKIGVLCVGVPIASVYAVKYIMKHYLNK